MTDCLQCLEMFIHTLSSATAVVKDDKIHDANSAFMRFISSTEAHVLHKPINDFFPEFSVSSMIADAIKIKGRQRAEKEILFNGIFRSILIIVLPLGDTAIVRAFDTGAQRNMQKAFLRQMRKLRTDDIWILDDQYLPLYFEAEDEMTSLATTAGWSPLSMVTEASKELAYEAFEDAKRKPTTTQSTILQTHRQGKVYTTYVDIVFLPDPFVVGHYFCCGRIREYAQLSVLNRLIDAFEVETDKELAHCLGTSAAAVSRVRSGGEVPSRWVIAAWRALGVSADWLLTGQGKKF